MKLSLNTNFTAFKMSAIVALLSLASVEPVVLGAQQSARTAAATNAPNKAVVASEEEESAAAPKKPGEEGIKVHGHWVIDVHNADGTIADHRDFQNSLDAAGGGNALMYLLTGAITATAMQIQVGTGGFTGSSFGSYTILPAGNVNAASQCQPGITGHCVTGLTKTVTPGTAVLTFTTPGKLVLQGQFAPDADFTFNSVRTGVVACSAPTLSVDTATSTPSQCSTVTFNNGAFGSVQQFYNFTSAGVGTIAVSAGQYVVINVTISFS